MAEMIHKLYVVKAEPGDAESRSVRVIASTDAIDGADQVVMQDWALDRYKANPIVLYLHNFLGCRPEDTLPIGSAPDVEIVDGHLEATLNFVDAKANPLAELVWQGFLQKSIRAVSVGFTSKNVLPETRDGKQVYVLSGNELLEISVCPIPMNPEAVAQTSKSLDIIRKLAAAGTTATTTPPTTPAAIEDPMTTKKKSTKADATDPSVTTDPKENKAPGDAPADPPAGGENDPDDVEDDSVICLLLGLPDDADDAAVMADIDAKISNLQAAKALIAGEDAAESGTKSEPSSDTPATKDPAMKALMSAKAQSSIQTILALVGVDAIEKAVGPIAAWKASAEQLPELLARITAEDATSEANAKSALIKKGVDDKKLTPAMKAWAETQDVEVVKSFLASAPVIPALKGTNVKEVAAKSAQATDLLTEIEGKKWEELKPMQKHRLLQHSPEMYESLKADHDARKNAT